MKNPKDNPLAPDALSRISFDSQEECRQVYDYIKAIVHLQPPDGCPPLHVLIYAIRNIMFPTLLLDQIPDMLELLAHIEYIRLHVASRARTILIWDAHYKQLPDEEILMLSHSDAALVKECTETYTQNLRSAYRAAVNGLSRLDIYETWCSPQRNHQTANRLNTYFPDLLPHSELARKVNLSQTLLHHQLSAEEHEDRDHIGVKCAQFIVDATQFTDNPSRYCMANNISPETATFSSCFPAPVDKAKLLRLVQWYLNGVEGTLTKMRTALSSKPGSRTSS